MGAEIVPEAAHAEPRGEPHEVNRQADHLIHADRGAEVVEPQEKQQDEDDEEDAERAIAGRLEGIVKPDPEKQG